MLWVIASDESELSWLQSELKDSARNKKIGQKQAKILILFLLLIILIEYDKILYLKYNIQLQEYLLSYISLARLGAFIA